jgi:SAM-dependent methyltransferase
MTLLRRIPARQKAFLQRMPGTRTLAKWLGLPFGQTHARGFLRRMLPNGSVGAEIGVYMGDFAGRVVRKVQPRELHLIDPWKHEDSGRYASALQGGKAQGGQAEMDARYEAVCEIFETEIRSGQVRVHRGYSDVVLETLPDEYFDWIYVDGNHYYEFVKQDLELWFRKIKPGGLIAGDDYSEPGWWEDGVRRAVDEFADSHGVQWVTVKHSQFVLRKSSNL